MNLSKIGALLNGTNNGAYNSIESLLLRRLIKVEHPIIPMKSGPRNAQTFLIDMKKRFKCKLPVHEYIITKKESFQEDSNYPDKKIRKRLFVNFYATMKYRSISINIGYATCTPGWVEQVFVNDEIMGGLDARNCGISTVLTELCFIDPGLNKVRRYITANKAVAFLEKYPDQLTDVKRYCSQIMGMEMSARPLEGAYAYFSAALRTGYRRMVVLANGGFHSFWVEDAQRLYVSEGAKRGKIMDTGGPRLIDECCDAVMKVMHLRGECDSWGKEWFFCKDI